MNMPHVKSLPNDDSFAKQTASSKSGWVRSVLPAIALVALVYLVTLTLSPLDGFWTTDDANKFLQMQAIISSNGQDATLPWPGHTIDPSYKYNPVPDPFTRVYQGKLYSIFPPFFATVTASFYKQLGFAGLYVLPLVSSLLLLVGLGRIAFAVTGRTEVQRLAILLAGLCTPLWFYSVVFWEHIVAASCGIWCIFFFLRYIKRERLADLVIGDLLLTLAIYFRDEMYLFAAVVIIAVAASSRTMRIPRAVLSFALVTLAIVPLWIFQAGMIASPMGHHLGDYFLSVSKVKQHILERPQVLFSLFLAASPVVWISILMSSPFIVALFLKPASSGKALLPALSAVAAACSLAYLAGLQSADSVIMYILRSCNSFFVAAPVVILGCIRLGTTAEDEIDSRRIRWLWATFVAYALIYTLAAQGGGLRGIHWGNRYVLILYPVLALLAAINIACWSRRLGPGQRSWRIPIILLIIISFSVQWFSIQVLNRKKEFSSRLNHALENASEKVIITDQWWAGQEMYSQFYRKLVFCARSPQDMEELANRLASAGVTQFIYATTSAGSGQWPGSTIVDNGLNFYSLKLCSGKINVSGAKPESPRM